MEHTGSREQEPSPVDYKGHILEPLPDRTPDGKWSPKVFVTLHQGDEVRTVDIYPKNRILFDDKEEACRVSLQLGRAAIDQGINWSQQGTCQP